jgi:hypothetical protein
MGHAYTTAALLDSNRLLIGFHYGLRKQLSLAERTPEKDSDTLR